MLKILKSGAVVGLDAVEITIEVDVSRGMPAFIIVGLPDTAVQESRERVRAAIVNSEYELEPRRVTINLAPADLRKEGPAFDLPIAVGVLLATAQIGRQSKPGDYWLVGELSLTGEVKPVSGIISIAVAAAKQGCKGLILPAANAAEAAVVTELDVIPVDTLAQAADFLNGALKIEPAKGGNGSRADLVQDIDFSDVKGQLQARRALEIAAAGGHNLLMVGPPGSGKSMLAQRLPTIMPSLSRDEAIEVTKIYSVSSQITSGQGLIWKRPFRAPHHTISSAGLAGGGQNPRPGEITLSHRGVLFLDEMPEFAPSVLQVLRQPLESKSVTIARASGALTYPAEFMLVGAMNPCPCGYLGDRKRECECSISKIRSYRTRVSGPLLDRIDIHIEVPRLTRDELMGEASATETSADIRSRVLDAREVQTRRFGDSATLNSRMTARQMKTMCRLSKEIEDWLGRVIDRLSLSARGFDRVIRIARTVADLADREDIALADVAEAVQYRVLDRPRLY